ncbi:MAG: restriction endonuclease subunit S [Chloroflexi bacterium]|nr:restriction endonuclease subunit S [Chloroflexota bacterium]
MKENNTSPWPLVPLGAISTKIGSGATPRGGKESYKNHGIALIRSLNVYDFEFSDDGLAFIDDKQADELANVEVQPKDLLLNITGASVARCCVVPEDVLPARVNQHVSIIRLDLELANPLYVLYCINSPQYKHHLLTLAQGGATREALTKGTISNFTIPLPSLATQNRIAAVLSAYDHLVDNNTRRIAILEEMAQSLYREWFVEFRFPGHGQVEMVDSTLGPVPEGWEVSHMADSCLIVMGQSPKSEFYNAEGRGLPFHQGVTNFGNRFPVDRVYCTVADRVAERGDILFSVRAPVGRMNISDKRIVIGRGLSAIRNKASHQRFTFHQLKERFQEEDSMGGGTIFKAVTRADMEDIKILDPPEGIVGHFEELIGPAFGEVEILTAKNSNLRLTRDLLLRMLISGEVDMSSLNIDVVET